MKPTLVKMAAFFLVAVLVIVGLTGCERSAREREAEVTEPAATSQATQPGTGAETAAPGETVVSAVTPPSEGTGTVVAVTQPPVSETSQPEGQATAVPTEEAQPSPESGGTTTQQGGAIIHTVQQGETLASIARRYGTTWQTIAQANDLVNPNQIYVGQKLKIPSGSTGSPSSGATG
ncbi:MAG: LysM peptidoglycan-binding domain-containing protein, partial [Anaerolineae bacterium]